jgi:hypothetical protein
MIKVTELRLGNWVSYRYSMGKTGDGPWEQDFIDKQLLRAKDIAYCEEVPSNFNPIPLTAEWLIKFGLEKHDEMRLYPNIPTYIDIINQVTVRKEESKWRFIYQGSRLLNNLKYVHQLQNLFFALTGEELTISTPIPT